LEKNLNKNIDTEIERERKNRWRHRFCCIDSWPNRWQYEACSPELTMRYRKNKWEKEKGNKDLTGKDRWSHVPPTTHHHLL
jgi:hypothetical protein